MSAALHPDVFIDNISIILYLCAHFTLTAYEQEFFFFAKLNLVNDKIVVT